MAKKRASPKDVDRPSTVDRLPPEIRDEIYRQRFSHGRTLDEILEHIRALGAPAISRRALGRHVKALSVQQKAQLDYDLAQLSPKMAFANALAASILSGIDKAETDNKVTAIREIMQSQILTLLLDVSKAEPDEDGNVPKLAVKDLNALARTVGALTNAEKSEDERIRKIVAAAKEEATAETLSAVKVAAAAAPSAGITDEVLEAATRLLLGEA